jgi:hypothetical protein
MILSHQPEPTHWHRNVRQLGNTVLEKALTEDLGTLYPESLHPFHIDVWGASDTILVRVRIWRPQPYMDVSTAIPEDFGGDAQAGILQRIADFVVDFSRER